MNELFLKYLNSVKLFEAPNDKGNEPPKKPEIIVESVDNREDKDKVVEEEVDETDPRDDDKEDEEEDKEDDDNKNENETDEQKTARIAQEKEDRRQNRIQKRIDKLTATIGNKDNEIVELKKQLAEKPKEGLTEEEVQRRAEAIAEAKLRDKQAEDETNTFKRQADDLIKGAKKFDKDFEKKIHDVAKDTDTLMPKYMVEILADLDNKNGAEILALLAEDEDLYEEICTLSERKMIRRLDKMSDELKSKKPKNGVEVVRPRERLPDPIEPINDGNNNRGNNLPNNPTKNMDDFVRVRALQQEQFRKTRGR